MLGEEATHGGRGPAKQRKGNVCVLDSLDKQQLPLRPNRDEMGRPPAILASRIVEHLTGEQLPLPPPAPYRPAYPMAKPPREGTTRPNAVAEPAYTLSPIAWSIKVVNLRRTFLPQLREEVIVLVHFSPDHFEKEAFENGSWVVAHLRRSSHDFFPETTHEADSESRWELAYTPRLFGSPPESARLSRSANVHLYKDKPTTKKVSKFVYSTDFGNNDIYAHTSVSNLMDVDVLFVALYPEFSELVDSLQSGLSPAEIERHRAAYEEEFRRKGIMPRPRKTR
jgi:hypothetical protein